MVCDDHITPPIQGSLGDRSWSNPTTYSNQGEGHVCLLCDL